MLVRLARVASTVAALILVVSGSAEAVWWGTYGTWDTQARRNAADASMRAVVDRFNAYGDFNWGNDGWVEVYYKPGVPTTQANYYGGIDFSGTWPNERVTQHEINHWFGTGTYWNWANQFSDGIWTGAAAPPSFTFGGTSLTVAGPYTVALTAPQNKHSGLTTVQAGTLQTAHAAALATTAVTVEAGAYGRGSYFPAGLVAATVAVVSKPASLPLAAVAGCIVAAHRRML